MGRSFAMPEARAFGPALIDSNATVSCPHCRQAAVWSALVPVAMLEGAALESHLAVRPDGWVVDVRACRRCGRRLARKVSASPPESAVIRRPPQEP